MCIGKQIRQIRFDLNKTQAEMALIVGVSQSYYSALEKGKKPVSKSLLNKLVTDFGLDPNPRTTITEALKFIPKGHSLNNGFKMVRINLGLTQSQVATALGVSKSYYSDMECNRRTVSAKMLYKFNSLYCEDTAGTGKIPLALNEMSMTARLDAYKNQLTNDITINDHDYRVMVRTIDSIKGLFE